MRDLFICFQVAEFTTNLAAGTPRGCISIRLIRFGICYSESWITSKRRVTFKGRLIYAGLVKRERREKEVFSAADASARSIAGKENTYILLLTFTFFLSLSLYIRSQLKTYFLFDIMEIHSQLSLSLPRCLREHGF